MSKEWFLFFCIFALTLFLAIFALPESFLSKLGISRPEFLDRPFKLGLDLKGGVNLLYQADLSQVAFDDRKDVMRGLRDIIERRINLFGVREPVVQVQGEDRLRVELAGIGDPKEAIKEIGKTPYLEFRELIPEEERKKMIEKLSEDELSALKKQAEETIGQEIEKEEIFKYLSLYQSTKLTGKYLKRASLQFEQTTFQPSVAIEFDNEGAKIFEELTRKNWHKPLAIFIDNNLISAPIVGRDDPAPQGTIKGGKALITGDFTVDEARQLARNLNAGALPAPINLATVETIGPILGERSLEKSLFAGMIGVFLILLFMILFYRFSGAIAIFCLFIQGILLLSLFKSIPVTLTLSGIAGLILFFGMAVDGNILIFERLREELKSLEDRTLVFRVLDNAFLRAWPAIRDGNLTTLIICAILFLIGSGFVQGFALTLGLGNIVNLFVVMVISRFMMKFFARTFLRKFTWGWTR